MVLVRLTIFVVFTFTALIQTTSSAAITSGNGNLGIVGGYEVPIKDVPFMAAVFLDGNFFCGGSIVHEKFILTAAHCIPDADSYYVKILIGSDRLNYGGIMVEVESMLPHPKYNRTVGHLRYDIALIKVRESLINSYLRTTRVTLPADRRVIQRGTMVNVTGWGWMKGDSYLVPNELRRVTIPVVSNSCCNLIYNILIDSQMCAGSQGLDSCRGDSGGPLTYEGVQIGVVSFGKFCGANPGVYTKVASYLDWIRTTIEVNKFNR